MDTANGQCSLFLCPVQHDLTFHDSTSLVSLLQAIGFISNKIDTDESRLRYYAGESFLNYVSYMGCAPAIQFEASETNPDFCFIEIHCFNSVKLIHSKKQPRAPHCPACNKPVKDWQQHVTMTDTILCKNCNTTSGIEFFNWRKMAGYASLFIEVTDIYPKEAMPQQALLNKLADDTCNEWQYFYSCK